jgi:hypothetical protein
VERNKSTYQDALIRSKDMLECQSGISAYWGAAKPSHDAFGFMFQGLDARLSGGEGAKVIQKILA